MTESLRLDWCTHQAAKYACKNWHYSKTLPPPPHVKVGVWEDEQFIGAIVFGRGVAPTLFRQYGLANTEGAELMRVALTRHRAPASKIVSVAVRMLKAKAPALRLLISFADPSHGHHGGIYQAMGWVFTGTSDGGPEFIGPMGQRLHNRMVSPRGLVRMFDRYQPAFKPSHCKRVRMPGKYRYLRPLDREMASRVESLRQPYPKRPKDQEPDSPSGLGGETPTRPLQPPE